MDRFARLEEFFGIDSEEIGLLLFFVLVSLYLFVESFSYSGFVGRYPRVFAAAVLLCAVLCLFRRRLPEPLSTITSEPPDLVGFDDEQDVDASTDAGAGNDELQDRRATAATARTVFGITLTKRAIVTLTVAGYIVASILVGILAATPLYVLAWGYLVGMDRNRLVAITVATTIALFGFMAFAGIRVDIGVLF